MAQKYNIHPQTLRLYEREGLLKPSRTDGNTGCIRRKTRTAGNDPDIDPRSRRQSAGVEVILNMRRKIQQMQGEVNDFMEYVKRELARGIDDWEQRLSTALRQIDVDRSRAHQPTSERARSRQKNRRGENFSDGLRRP